MSSNPSPKKFAGPLFLAVGTMLFAVAVLAKQPAFIGVGVVFIVVGAVQLKKAKDAGPPQPPPS